MPKPNPRKHLESLLWKYTHADFKGRLDDGTKTVLRCDPKLGTVLVAISSLTDEDLRSLLPSKAREVLKRESEGTY